MAPLDKFVASFLTVENENTAALVSAKFDFTLFKFDAPSEYSQVGSALSRGRRLDAENGPIHRTARRLAALFEQRIPSTPKLVAAYGKRVSSIITRSEVNPVGSAKDGPFESFVGADGTAMWAAATSGSGAMGVYLLACFLCRLWDTKYAISIWMGLIASRRAEIRAEFEQGGKVSEAALMSTFQEISRQDLAIWDASARAWLQTAEQVKQIRWQLTQLHLVTKDLTLPFINGPTMYSNVMSSWTHAMQGLEDLLSGIPQEISNAAILTAFGSWHLFPDLIVLAQSTTKVSFADELFPEHAIGTIGLRASRSEKDAGIQWSLVLSHLEFYGPPVEVTTFSGPPKVEFFRLRLAALGALFAQWDLNHRQYFEAAKFLSELWEVVLEALRPITTRSWMAQFEWLEVFVQAANELLLASSSNERIFKDYMQLVAYGARRGVHFLGKSPEQFNASQLSSDVNVRPFFGLTNRAVLKALSAPTETDASIAYLRGIAQDSGCEPHDGLVMTGHWSEGRDPSFTPDFYEYTSLLPGSQESRKRKADAEDLEHTTITHGLFAGWAASEQGTPENRRMSARIASLNASGHRCHVSLTHDPEMKVNGEAVWGKALDLFTSSSCPQSELRSDRSYQAEHMHQSEFSVPDVSFTVSHGTYASGLILTKYKRLELYTECDVQEAILSIKKSANRELLLAYLHCISRLSNEHTFNTSTMPAFSSADLGVKFVAKRFALTIEECAAFWSLAMANAVYATVSVPTVSLECLEASLSGISWARGISSISGYDLQEFKLREPTREEALSCICFFDSGSIALEPEELENVFAMCCNNSIYVAAIALQDPARRAPSYEIHHIMGSIGKSGISMLVSPKFPRIRAPSYDYRVVSHQDYDLKREDNFRDTTLHLWFTEWSIPVIDTDLTRTIDHAVNLVEAVISLRERGQFVADLDILSIDFRSLDIANDAKSQQSCTCPPTANKELIENFDIKSIDSWDELLDQPKETCIVRAHGNWAARLAATSILYQQKQGHATCLFDSSSMCLNCLAKDRDAVGHAGLRRYEANLPHFLID